MSFSKPDLKAVETYMVNHLRLFLFMAIGLIVFVGIIAVSVFFVYVRGAEQTMVPNIQGQELTAALLELQVKELYPRINLRYTQSSADRGLVLEQSPLAGAIVKAGRRIQLVVSQGAVVNAVENYVGRNVEDVRSDLQNFTMSEASQGFAAQFLTLREPLMYQFSEEPAGTILQQNPLPGTNISGPTTLELVVSQGLQGTMMRVPNLTGLGLESVLEQIGITGIDFEFSIRPASDGERPGTVVAQNPEADAMADSGARIGITMSYPARLSENETFGLFVYDMPKNPYPLLIRLESILPNGDRQRLLSVQYPGGRLSVPYREPVGSVLVLYMLNREIYRETVNYSVEGLSLDGL